MLVAVCLLGSGGGGELLPWATGFFRESQANGLDNFLVTAAGICFEAGPQEGAGGPPMTGVVEFEP